MMKKFIAMLVGLCLAATLSAAPPGNVSGIAKTNDYTSAIGTAILGKTCAIATLDTACIDMEAVDADLTSGVAKAITTTEITSAYDIEDAPYIADHTAKLMICDSGGVTSGTSQYLSINKHTPAPEIYSDTGGTVSVSSEAIVATVSREVSGFDKTLQGAPSAGTSSELSMQEQTSWGSDMRKESVTTGSSHSLSLNICDFDGQLIAT